MKKVLPYIILIVATCLAACEDDGINGIGNSDITKKNDFLNVPYDTTGSIVGHSYVDIGVSVLWATCNINATHPLMSGSYFAWGETMPKEVYSWDNYKYCKGKNLLTKYNFKKESGNDEMVDSIYTLEAEDDAAVQNWGGGWRMPTVKEFDELRNQCEWVWVNGESANYYKVTGPNGKSILLPACGYMNGRKPVMYMENGCIWSSSIFESIPTLGYELTQYATGFWIGRADRFYGEPIRPVIDSKNIVNTSKP